MKVRRHRPSRPRRLIEKSILIAEASATFQVARSFSSLHQLHRKFSRSDLMVDAYLDAMRKYAVFTGRPLERNIGSLSWRFSCSP